jgi:hypothetical protein
MLQNIRISKTPAADSYGMIGIIREIDHVI